MNVLEEQVEQEKPKDFDRYWLKIFNDIQTDMRFVTMSYEHQGIFFNLLVLANNAFGVGRIYASRDELARALRISRTRVNAALDDFESRSLVFVEGNTVQIADERHYKGPGLNPSDSREAKAERVRQSRARTREAEQERLREAATRSSHESPARVDKDSEGQTRESEGQRRDNDLADKEKGPYDTDDHSDGFRPLAIEGDHSWLNDDDDDEPPLL